MEFSWGEPSMKERLWIAGVLATFLLVSTSQAQVAQLGRMPTTGKIKQVGLLGHLFNKQSKGCDSCGDPGCGIADPGCGIADPGCGLEGPVCGAADPVCGAGAPTCGMAGSILGRRHGGGCGVPEPGCGSAGLGYSGGFGLCGGSCDSCGVGGYFGRNLHQVNPCACGGSLVADLARGVITMVDRAVGKVVGGVFGGLQAVSCHASGTFAALQCAAQAGCNACGGSGCEGGCAVDPGCGLADPHCGIATSPSYSYSEGGQVYSYDDGGATTRAYATSPSPATSDLLMPPAPPTAPTAIESDPLQPKPVSNQQSDPFLDDPINPQSKTRSRTSPLSREYDPRTQQVRNTHRPQNPVRIGSSVQQTMNRVKAATAHVATPLQSRYLQPQNRSVMIRR